MNEHSGKTAIVTGASSGIGRVSAEALARAGFTVFGTSRRAISNAPDQVTMLRCDVTDAESVDALVSAVLAKTGRVDLLVNNAGIGLLAGAEESSIEQVRALFDVNLFGVVRMTNAVLPAMRRKGGGRIINIGSILGVIPAPYSAHYSAVKHAVEGYSESLDHEIRAFGIRVSVIEPAFVRTVFDQNGIEPDRVMREYDQARAGVDALLRDVMPKADAPEVVAQVILQAATDRHPRRRYTAGKAARQVSLLRRFAPAEMFDKTLRKQFRLPV
ncbi:MULTISPECIES: oxidoreductase [unclassified Mesorhizobium]|uniref:oxidoreductase n=1 Tax=unclassified Mesorhizobium TaxID=325217 RepID=UPI000FCBCBDC|nr:MULTISPECIES: oxidoreductase [unclassified Mesorhizobium]TIT80272.1 MAG: SDR family NAD(P)-dependent oxidoreductase [Mesorhizobium sp.]TGP20351.1 oxidoreductase [Mesorhizobium sp. M1D.F.Ca.ET.231.01.1.1]TGP27827.1 oxidoreductase [Mesorhizobium sp. M1D.F.Ca.ET.234.01.1.1]TGS42177.1 oxidoreductase [Mesorhizobium sp. M1D.F.Ca.ET.184.01.1.1]TGS59528.1 oxidoreductase [Mesorhizobium sp. M1D.F.Ca.ET.183.01.1.1]